MSAPDSRERHWQPKRPRLTALAVFTVAALSLCWPMLTGQFLVGPNSDQYSAGYAFREFGARMLRETGAVPEWNPYLFGGMPFIAAMHGDIFYPTSWLRAVLPTDAAMNLAFLLHFIVAGATMFALLRRLNVSWTGALIGGVGYELSGILASMVSPGHDGKLFVSALSPLAFLALIVIVRDGRRWGYALLAAVTGFALLSPHYQMTYYLLVAAGVFALWLAFADPERRAGLQPIPVLAFSAMAVGLGVACSAVQALPFLEYIPFSPRGAGGPSTGWDYATSFSLPLSELFTTVLPQFNGVLGNYWGENFFKLHSEYVGVVVVVLAILGLTDKDRGAIRWGFTAVLVLGLVIASGKHTPFYRLWYEVMPMMKKVRAPGMAFFLVALALCVFAGFGTDRLLRRRPPSLALVGGLFGGFALLGLLGGLGALQPLAEGLAVDQMIERAIGNAGELRAGGWRLLLAAGLGFGVAFLIVRRQAEEFGAALILALVVIGDLWSVDRTFFTFSPPASQLFAADEITAKLQATPTPYRVLDPFPGTVYEHSILMGLGVPQTFGYHGNEVRFYDELWGGKNVYQHMPRLQLWDLWAVRYLLLPADQPVPGYHKVVGPVTTAQGATGVLFERDSLAPYARVVAAAAKAPDDQIVPTVADPRFPVRELVLFSDTTSVQGPLIQPGEMPPLTPVTASVTAWAPGRMTITLEGKDTRPTFLVVSETWYPGWTATVDGQSTPVLRGNGAMLTVPVPAGAREVSLAFHLASYDRGTQVSLASWGLVLLLAATSGIGGAGFRRRAKGAA